MNQVHGQMTEGEEVVSIFRMSAAALLSLGTIVTSASAAVIFDGTLYYTTFAGGENVWRVGVTYNDAPNTLTVGASVNLASTPGADGIVINPKPNPDNPDRLLVGGQANGQVHNVKIDGTGFTSTNANTDNVFHLAVINVGAGVLNLMSTGIPGTLVKYSIAANGDLSPGIVIPVMTPTGAALDITQVIQTPAGFFYTASDNLGVGSLGTLAFNGTFTSAVATEVFGDIPGAHGGLYDPFTNSIIIVGDGEIRQYDLTLTLVSQLLEAAFPGGGSPNPNEDHFDQAAVDGKGLLFVANNDGRLFFVDYRASGLVGGPGNFLNQQFLKEDLDDIAPIIVVGRTELPEPANLALIALSLTLFIVAWRGRSVRRRRTPFGG